MSIAIVTGASSGIGKEFALQLDKENFDEIWAIAFTKSKLEALIPLLKTKVKIFALDLTKSESFEELKKELEQQKPEVSWLVNCSGFGKFGRYDEIEEKDCMEMIDLNCKGYVNMIQKVLPYMPNNSRIVNIASMASWQSVPYANIYASTKAFVLSYSRGLNVELKHRNISVTAICPFWTKTAFFNRAEKTNNNRINKYVVMYDATKVVKKAIKDAKKRKDVSIYGFVAKLYKFMGRIMSHKCLMKIWIRQQKPKKNKK